MTEAKDIQLHFNVDSYTQKLLLNMEQRKNIYLIFKEAVNNAVKYSGCKNLFVSIKHHAGKLEMIIEDDGVGFEPGAVTQVNLMGGNGLKSMKLRAKNIEGILNIDTQESRGTRVVFSMLVH
jgi:signal transduction histidine kinase